MFMRSHITFIAIAAMLFSVIQPATTLASQTIPSDTCPLGTYTPYKSLEHAAVYYVDRNCTRTLIDTEEKYFSYFSSWDSVETVDQSQIDAIPEGELGFLPWGSRTQLKNGELFKIAGSNRPMVYLYMDGLAHPIESEDAFIEHGYQWDWVVDLNDSYAVASRFWNPRTGRAARAIASVDWLPAGSMVRIADSPDVFVLENEGGTKAWNHVPDMETLRQTDFHESRISVISQRTWTSLQAEWPTEYWCSEFTQSGEPTRRSAHTVPWHQGYFNTGYSTGFYQVDSPQECQSDLPEIIVD